MKGWHKSLGPCTLMGDAKEAHGSWLQFSSSCYDHLGSVSADALCLYLLSRNKINLKTTGKEKQKWSSNVTKHPLKGGDRFDSLRAAVSYLCSK